MGEAPELDWVTLAMQADQIMTDQHGLLQQQAQIIAEVTALHQRMHYSDKHTAWDYCEHDNAPWPCETMRIVERVAL